MWKGSLVIMLLFSWFAKPCRIDQQYRLCNLIGRFRWLRLKPFLKNKRFIMFFVFCPIYQSDSSLHKLFLQYCHLVLIFFDFPAIFLFERRPFGRIMAKPLPKCSAWSYFLQPQIDGCFFFCQSARP